MRSPRLFLLLVLAWITACARREPPPPGPPVPLPQEGDRQVLGAAMHECFTTDCQDAMTKLARLPADSPLRQTDEFRAIEYRRIADDLLAADLEPVAQTRRARLEAIQLSPSVPASLRTAATLRLEKLAPAPPSSFRVVFAGADGRRASVDNGPTTTSSQAPTASDPVSVFDLAHSGKKGNLRKARAILEGEVASGRATQEEVKLLEQVCKSLADASCVNALRKRLHPRQAADLAQ